MSKRITKPAAAAAIGLAGSAAYLWANSEPEGYHFDPSSLIEQSYAHPTIPACRVAKESCGVVEYDTSSTLYDIFIRAVEKNGSKKFLGKRSSLKTGFDTWITYSEALDRVTKIGYGLRRLGMEPGPRSFIGLYSGNRMEMVLTQLASYQQSMVVVPMYETLGAEGMEHIVTQTRMKLVICDMEAKVAQLVEWGVSRLPHLTTIVHMESVSPNTVQAVRSQGWSIISFSEMEADGANNPVGLAICKGDDLALVCYTSGTTGKPKGAMIEHNAFYRTAMIALKAVFLPIDNLLGDDETYLSYLPLAHLYEQMMMVEMMLFGAKIGFFSGDVTQLLSDLQHLKPTYFASVPRILTKIYDKVMSSVNQSYVKRRLFEKALNAKEYYLKRGIITKSTVWDKILFKKLRDLLGGRVKIVMTGSAPIAYPVLRFLRLALGAVILEGYGMTESTAGASGTLVGESSAGEVGRPLPCNMIKLIDVPEMNYYASDNIGEICLKGLNVFKGYLDDEERTREVIDEDGWLHTGDVGTWTERGTLRIVDRKKNIFKLSQGEYIAPEKIENAYITCPLVAQCYVHGDSLQSYLVAVVVPDAEVLQEFAETQLALKDHSLAELCKSDEVKVAVLAGMADSAKLFNLKGFEQVKVIHLTAEPLTVENGLLTPTQKLKRLECKNRYKRVIAQMYGELNREPRVKSAL
ncbi:long-chain-fatty-acid--CoA ligase 1-like isoform X2 [Watersipora subatra]|uniref:long-chain-fatty-acid--CoA ligase 1-like isoform X1 n=1 Tax=Watersipora subatra TaxID=2589382 RepID=UPI00355AE95E